MFTARAGLLCSPVNLLDICAYKLSGILCENNPLNLHAATLRGHANMVYTGEEDKLAKEIYERVIQLF